MKKHFLKSFALLAMLFSALTLSAQSGVDWSTYEFLGDGAGGGKYTNKYKVSAAEGLSVVNIQQPGFTDQHSIYATVPAGISDCNVSSTIQGAGIALHLSAFTAKETQVTINYAGGSCTFWVYYADGTEGGEGGEEPEPTPDPEEPEDGTIDWEAIAWVEASDDKFKVYSECLTAVINVQQPVWSDEAGIYVSVPAGISECSVNGAIDGAGMILYLSSFTAKETEVTITHGLGSCTFWVYYADGTEDGGETPSTPTEIYDVNFALASNGSSAEATSGDAAQAIDNNPGSRWESAQEDPQTWTLDLGQARIFNTLEIVWEGAYGKTFTVSVSDDKENWTPVWTVEDQQLAGFPYTQTQTIDKTTARYIQFHGTERGTGYGYSFWEFRVYLAGTSTLTSLEAKPANGITKVGEGLDINVVAKDQNGQVMANAGEITYTVTPADAGTVVNNIYTPAKIGSATIVAAIGEVKAAAFDVFAYDGENVALSTDINNSKIVAQSDFAPSGTDAWHAIDGNEGSVWQGSATNGGAGDEAARTYDSWFIVDFGGYYDINLVTIQFEGACSQEYHVDFSADNATWNQAYNYVGAANVNPHTQRIYGADLQNTNKVRYARFFSTKAATQWGMKIFEFKVFGTPWVAPADDVKPVMGTAELVSTTFNSAVIAVTATDNEEVGKYRVVSAAPEYDKTFAPTDGKITVTGLTASTKYTFTITAVDLAGNESENAATVEVTTDKHDVKPTTAPATPTVDAKKVMAVYSDVYACSFSAMEGWGQATQFEELNFDGDRVRYYTNLNYLGWATATPINALNMEKLHLDIWAENTGSLKVTPIYGGAGLQTDDQKGLVVALQGQQWNAIEFDLTDFVGLDFSSIFQFKFDIPVGGNVFAIDNVYFYRETEIADTEAPTDAVATLKSVSYTSVVITCQAADNSGMVSFDIFDGETKLATSGAESDKPVDVTVAGLESGKTYSLSVVAYDINENKAEPVVVTATTTALPAPASAPTHAADSVMSIYSDAYTPEWTTLNSFNEGWWNAPQMAEVELTEGDNALYYFGFTDGMVGWQFAAFNATGYTTFTMDIYPLADGTITCGPLGEGGADYAVTGVAVKGNQWNTITIDLTDKDLTAIFQVKMIDYYALGSFFVDNVYLYKPAASNPGTAVENTQVEVQSHKLIRHGVLYIIRNGVTYDVMGRVVR